MPAQKERTAPALAGPLAGFSRSPGLIDRPSANCGSPPERVLHQDDVVAFGAGGEKRNGGFDRLFDAADIFDRFSRQIGPAARAGGGT